MADIPMQEDNLYKRSSEFVPGLEPEDQADERKKEQNEVFAEMPILKEVADGLRADIEHYKSVYAIPADIRLEPHKLAVRVDSNAETVANLQKALESIETVVAAHK